MKQENIFYLFLSAFILAIKVHNMYINDNIGYLRFIILILFIYTTLVDYNELYLNLNSEPLETINTL